ncbi:MAG: tetrahydromethanopterin synthesis protein [Gammaproteobacteria bacterium RIFCSPLOWO2_12_47_11]|nr:MAG: tetrahydromethanopterin synthesis protein [Gammaproteobacteria bacterium RIFCSPLOWO2_12_47_11]
MIREAILTTLNADNSVHIAPMGVREIDNQILIAPFKPSTTLDNIKCNGQAVVNLTDDVRIFAGCLTGHYDWPTVPASVITGQRLENTLSHLELEVRKFDDDKHRPKFFCEIRHQKIHRPFMGFNRAQAAVLELAILVSRLPMLPQEKIDTEIKYLEIALEKTAGKDEIEAWGWLMDRISEYRLQQAASENMV